MRMGLRAGFGRAARVYGRYGLLGFLRVVGGGFKLRTQRWGAAVVIEILLLQGSFYYAGFGCSFTVRVKLCVTVPASIALQYYSIIAL